MAKKQQPTIPTKRFRKIAIKSSGAYLLVWITDNGDINAIESKEQALPEFAEALEPFGDQVKDLVPLDMGKVASVVATEISFRENQDADRTVIIKATVTPVSGDECTIKTPAFPLAEQEAHSPDQQRLAICLAELVEALEQEATKYQSGKRAQLELVGEDEEAA